MQNYVSFHSLYSDECVTDMVYFTTTLTYLAIKKNNRQLMIYSFSVRQFMFTDTTYIIPIKKYDRSKYVLGFG
jgi:hypothetical protein